MEEALQDLSKPRISALSLGNGTNHTEHHGRQQHLKMEKIIRSCNTSSSQG